MNFTFPVLKSTVLSFLTQGHERSLKAKKNIIAAFLIKGISIAISLFMVPLTIHFVNPTQYGILLTLGSIIGWFSFFDIGFGNGLRNKFAEAVASGNFELARIYVSTTYAILSLIIGIVLVLFFIVNPFLDWSKILNTPPSMAGELSIVAMVVFVFFCIQFILNLLTTTITANQQPAKASLLTLISSIISLIIIFILSKTTQGNLLHLSLVFGATPVFVFFVSSFWFYSRQYRKFAPSYKYVKIAYARDLMTLGVKFFFLQIAGIILYQSSNIIIAQLFGPAQVTPYNIAYKYFSVIPMVLGIILMPFWSAYTEAWVKQDITWIKSSLKKLTIIWGIFSVITLIMLAFSNFIYMLWVGKEIKVPFGVSLALAAYVIMNAWTNIYSLFLNGAGKIKVQLYASVLGMFVNIPLAIYLGKTFGIAGVVWSTVILCLFNMVLEPLQTKKILDKTAKGIWNE